MRIQWGPGQPRRRTVPRNWSQPLRWNGLAGAEPWRVFCGSLCDVADNEVPQQWRDDLMGLVEATPKLSWLLCTKRIGNVRRLFSRWGGAIPPQVRFLITITSQKEAERDLDALLALGCANGVSCEPLLEELDLTRWLRSSGGLQWIIVGGESKQPTYTPRPFNLMWAYSLLAQGAEVGCPVFVKQLGAAPGVWSERSSARSWITFSDAAGADPREWPEDLRVREFPS